MARRQRRRRRQRRQGHAKQRGWKTRYSVITGAGLVAGAALGMASGAQAAGTTYYVGSNGDTTGATDCGDSTNTDCTLRDAVYAANANSGYLDYVVFTSNVSGAVTLGGTDILIDDPVRIYGRGADVDTVSGNGNSRIFDIDMTTGGDEALIYGLTLTGGAETLGGAIYDKNAYLTVVDSILTGNSATDAGGAIYEYGGYNYGTGTVVAYSTLDHNAADYGGGIAGRSSMGILGGSTVASNTAHVGGGVFNAGAGYGGRLFDSTVSGNSSDEAGGGITLYYAAGYSTILGNNLNADGPADTFDVYLYAVGSLIEAPGSTVDGFSNITGVDPQLGSLTNNGGRTPTLKPAAGSPVVDKGFSYVSYDQRAMPRIVDNPIVSNAFGPPYGGADMGSVELTLGEGPQPTPAPTPIPHKKKKKCKKKKHHRAAQSAKKKKCKKKKKRFARGARSAAGAIDSWRAAADSHSREGHWGDRAWRFGR